MEMLISRFHDSSARGSVTVSQSLAPSVNTALEVRNNWPSWEEFLVASLDPAIVPKLHPGLGNKHLDTWDVLDKIKEQLLYFGRYILLHSPSEHCRKASLTQVMKKTTGSYNRLYLAPIHLPNQKASASQRPVWIIRITVLEELIATENWSGLREKGVWRYVCATPYLGNSCDVRPPIHVLPSIGSQPEPIAENGERVLILFLRDMHQEANVYRSYAAASRTLAISERQDGAISSSSSLPYTPPELRTFSSMRIWFNLELRPHLHAGQCSKHYKPRDASHVIGGILGAPSSRVEKVRAAARAINVEELSPEQWEVAFALQRPGVVDAVAGSGKSALQQIIMHMAVNSHSPPLLFYVSEANFMVHEMYDSCTWLPAERKLLLASEEIGGRIQNHGDIFINTIADNFLRQELPDVAVYDNVLELLHSVLKKVEDSEVVSNVVALYVYLQARRHLLLFLTFYGPLRAHQKEQIAKLRIVFMTHNGLIKLHGHRHMWKELLASDRDRILHIDEMQLRGVEEIGAMVAHFDSFFGTGDANQRPWQCQRQTDVNNATDLLSSHNDGDSQAQPLLWNNSMEWARKTAAGGYLQYFQHCQTRRYGVEVVKLQQMLADRFWKLSSHSEAPNTLIVPVLFPKLGRKDWVQSSKGDEVGRCKTFFTVALVLAAIEGVLFRLRVTAGRATSDSTCVVLVTGFLLSFLDQLQC